MQIKFLTSLAVAAALVPAAAFAQPAPGVSTTTGVVGGAVTGAVVGGPVGAVVGAVVGGSIGAAAEPPAEVRTYVMQAPPPATRVEAQIVEGQPLASHVEVRPGAEISAILLCRGQQPPRHRRAEDPPGDQGLRVGRSRACAKIGTHKITACAKIGTHKDRRRFLFPLPSPLAGEGAELRSSEAGEGALPGYPRMYIPLVPRIRSLESLPEIGTIE